MSTLTATARRPLLIAPGDGDEATADLNYTVQLQEWLKREWPTYPAMLMEGGLPNNNVETQGAGGLTVLLTSRSASASSRSTAAPGSPWRSSTSCPRGALRPAPRPADHG